MARKNWLHAPFIAGLLAAVTYLFIQGASPDPRQHLRTLQGISALQRINAELGRDLLLARTGMLLHYDGVNREIAGLHRHLEELRAASMASPDMFPPEITRRIDAIADNISYKEALVEQFKSSNALLRNSWAYFVYRSGEITRLDASPGSAEFAGVMARLSPAMLQVFRRPQGEADGTAGMLLDRLEQTAVPGRLKAQTNSLVVHGRLILSLTPQWDGDLRALLATPTGLLIDALRDRYLEHRGRVEHRAEVHRRLLYVVSVLLLIYLIYLAFRLQAGNNALARLNKELLEEIGERRQAEEVSRKHQAELAHVHRLSIMDEMASGLAHELNQPLTAINIYTKGCVRRLQQMNGRQSDLLDAMAKVSDEARRAGEILSWMRGFIRKKEPQRDLVDINSAIREALGLMDHELRNQGIRANLDLAASLPSAIADRIQIQQIVLNLVRNSMEAMGREDRTPRDLTIRTTPAGRGAIEVAVRDTGQGIPPGDLEHIFDSFYTTKAGGLGLGLSICRSLVEAHGGRLWATSDAGNGTIFRFVLPVRAEGHDATG